LQALKNFTIYEFHQCPPKSPCWLPFGKAKASIVKKKLFLVIFIVIACMFSVVVSLWQSNHLTRCSLDGSRIASCYEVTITYNNEHEKHFSCILSAQLWLNENRDNIQSIMVTDEVDGEKIDSKKAFFVTSSVVTNFFTKNRTHVFKNKTAALSHAKKFNGTLIVRPFQVHKKRPVFFVQSSTRRPLCQDFSFTFFQKQFVLSDSMVAKNPQNGCYLNKQLSFRISAGYPALHYKPPKHT